MSAFTRFWKITVILLGIVIVALGLYSHIYSDWRTANRYADPCQQSSFNYHGWSYEWCPPITIEVYFIVINVLCLILSIASLCFANELEKPSQLLKRVDKFYHYVASLLLLIAGILLIASSLKVQSMRLHVVRRELSMMTVEKVIAGVLTIIQA
ncbi:hypothetical protein Ocin01_17807 [Orchesella cincta]|uniref:Uncharacterized protein n=1 Tax=Orchesella cincta TaxID=48709 RepID=A0A1D2M7C6_ORCCI|nr:hypothetical protein Ocin01_17807 [Orchesella cincta]